MKFRKFSKTYITHLVMYVITVFGAIPFSALIKRLLMKFRGNIYPIELPRIEVNEGLDFLILELPPRYSPMIPNGIGYLYNILKESDISFQMLDMNILTYHAYNQRRLLDKTPILTSGGYRLEGDLWGLASMSEWKKPEVVEHFSNELGTLVDEILMKRPKAIGISVHECNRYLAREFVKRLRDKIPDVKIVVGGYDCVRHYLGPLIFKDFDYMVIGEAEGKLAPLLDAIKKKSWEGDMPGIISSFDSPDRKFENVPLLDNLDSIDYPKYEWTDLSLYFTFNGQHMVPITASRGCKWSRCRFCSECFPFRKRSPIKVVDEIEHLVSKGFYKFAFNESDVNGDPQNLYEICSEIRARKLKVQLGGQLRIDRRSSKEYFRHLAKAGFTHLRFGVDGWSQNSLRLQRKGYNMKLVFKNLRDCYLAGINNSVNVVIGVPGETENDIDEIIDNLLQCRNWINLVENINTLIIAAGSEYYNNPGEYNIRFRGEKDQIYKANPYVIPAEFWYSEEPYIDQEIRLNRLERIHEALEKNGMRIGQFASKTNFLKKLQGYYNP